MRDSAALWFLYRTIPGRAILKVLVHPRVSNVAGAFLSCRASRCLVPYYIRRHHIDMRDICVPKGGFRSFNDFFTRKRKHTAFQELPGCLYSPCDGLLSWTKITDGAEFAIKHTRYALADLLKDDALAKQFQGGLALIFRLTPAHYHRYCYAASGSIVCQKKINGVLHCVRPVALRTYPVFVQNSREYQVIRSEKCGALVQMEIGALLVGRIHNRPLSAEKVRVRAGMEKGYFAFGGSTIVLLIPKGTGRLSEALRHGKNKEGEIAVRMGDLIWQAKDGCAEDGNPKESLQYFWEMV